MPHSYMFVHLIDQGLPTVLQFKKLLILPKKNSNKKTSWLKTPRGAEINLITP